PDLKRCEAQNWYIPEADPCYPSVVPLPGQQVYIKDHLQNNFYNVSKLPTVVQAEGYVQSFCMGDYLTPGALPLPKYGIRSAHVVKNFVAPGGMYMQIHGTLDCKVLNINCTQSAPGVYDDGGQYDNAPFKSCGKEPYSGVDSSAKGNPGFVNYVEMAGNSNFCMRVCEAGTMVPGGPCDVTQDTVGCEKFMQVQFREGFSYTDMATGAVTTTSIYLPPLTTAAPSAKSTSIAVQTDGNTSAGSGNAKSGAVGSILGAGVAIASVLLVSV
ncbi:hypothetical protein BDR26DRAFT_866076, partial [Obelidium mucronatum]